MKTKYVVEIAYDGLNFHGFAMQPGKRTVESELNEKLSDIYGQEIKIIKSSRTDTGVHALEYTFAFETEVVRDFKALKRFIEERIPDVRFNKMFTIDPSFHPQHHALERTYVYKIYTKDDFVATKMRNYQFNYKGFINKPLLKELSKKIIGERDFASFTAREKYDNTIKNVTKIEFVDTRKKNGVFAIKVSGTGFMR